MTRSPSIDGRPLFLVGFMGTGKSTVGRLLGERLNRPFLDLDERIESEASSSIAEIFAAEGEPGFRARERELLGRAAGEGAQVIAVGGGAPCHGDNLKRMLEAGVVVCLTATPDEILERVGDFSSRPLLAAAVDRRAEVVRLLAERAAFYAQAHFTVDTAGAPPSRVVAEILKELQP